jgi:DNA-binding transcriptional MerR regulator
MRIGEVARQTGVTVDTVRVYDRRGLLPDAVRSANGYRDFPPSTVKRVRVIRGALAVGLTLRQLGQFFAQRERGEAPCRGARRAAAERLERVRAQRLELGRIERELRRLLVEWDRRLAETVPGSPARLLESIPELGFVDARRLSPRLEPALRTATERRRKRVPSR